MSMIDIAIVGGGLAGGLIALAIHRAHPDKQIALFEAGESLGGNHRWSWFENDLSREGAALMALFAITHWDKGNEVRFPAHQRFLKANYRSLGSADFDAALRTNLPPAAVRTGSWVKSLHPGKIVLEGSDEVAARAIIDCRDALPSPHLAGGWQVFLGQHLRTATPHGIERPIIMDATVVQHDAYRFVYVLPLGPNEVFIEDTYYANSPVLNAVLLRERIAKYCTAQGWQTEVMHEETGVLPVITGGDFPAYRADMTEPGVALAGARGGFVHPLTSYTLAIAVTNALAIAEQAHLPGPQLAEFVSRRAQSHWRETHFYRLLGKMLFDAAEPSKRYRIFERFYRLPEPLIERFYAARSTPADKIRILSGKPPVPIPAAIKALLGKGVPLVQGQG